jgi:DNA-binding CsgD family transcriptional regulator/PAS domain-containing protein
MTGRSADEAIAALYTAAVDPSQWDAALGALTRLADARAANCFVHDALTERFLEYRFIGYGPNWADGYARHYHGLDLARRVLLREPAGQMYAMHRHVTSGMVESSPYYQDFYIPEGLRYSCGGTLFDGNRRLILAVHRPVAHRPFEEQTVAELQRVLDHLPNVFHVRELAARTRDNSLMSSTALDALPRAVAIVDEGMNLQYLNAAAEALLNTSAEVRIRANRLSTSETRLAHQLAQRVKSACQMTPTVDPVPLYTANADGRPSVELHVVPLKPQLAADFGCARPLAMVLLRRPFHCAEWLRSANRPYALSRAEMAVVAALIEGLTPAEHAERSGVKISTVRSQIKTILAKTGTRRMAEVAILFAAIEAPPASDPVRRLHGTGVETSDARLEFSPAKSDRGAQG